MTDKQSEEEKAAIGLKLAKAKARVAEARADINIINAQEERERVRGRIAKIKADIVEDELRAVKAEFEIAEVKKHIANL